MCSTCSTSSEWCQAMGSLAVCAELHSREACSGPSVHLHMAPNRGIAAVGCVRARVLCSSSAARRKLARRVQHVQHKLQVVPGHGVVSRACTAELHRAARRAAARALAHGA